MNDDEWHVLTMRTMTMFFRDRKEIPHKEVKPQPYLTPSTRPTTKMNDEELRYRLCSCPSRYDDTMERR